MIFQTPTQFAILGLCLIAGWLFGLATAPGGRHAKARLREVEAEHTAYRKEAEARIKAAEVERDRLARAAPVTAQMTGTTTAAASAAATARPARSGFFGWSGDNLSRIRGIDESTERALHADGIKTYAAIEALTATDEAALEDRLNLGRGRIAQEHWREQAAMLREGQDDGHAGRWPR